MPRLRCRAGEVAAQGVRSCRRCVGPQMEPPPGAAGRGGRRAGGRARGREGKREGRRKDGGAAERPQTYSPPPPDLLSPTAARLARASCGKPPSLSAGPSPPPERAVARAAAHRRWVLGRATLRGSGPSSARFLADWDLPAALSGLPPPPPSLPPCCRRRDLQRQGAGSSGACRCPRVPAVASVAV